MWRDGSPRYPDHITGPEPPWEKPDFRYFPNIFFFMPLYDFKRIKEGENNALL